MVLDPPGDGPDRWDFEPSEHEPEEWDPEADFRNPGTDSITIPEVETSESDVPPDLLRAFWSLVLVINVAVFAVSLGAMLIAFRADFYYGGVLLVGGIALFGFAYRRYRHVRDGDFADPESANDTSSVDDGDSTTADADTASADDDPVAADGDASAGDDVADTDDEPTRAETTSTPGPQPTSQHDPDSNQ